MSIQITIIGLGQIGTSIGLGLAGQKQIVRVGQDIEPSVVKKAEKLGAVDKVIINMTKAVKEADVVILALPVDQIKETLEFIAPELKPGAVVIDTAPVKAAVAEWAEKALPEGRYYVGMTPVINPIYLMDGDWGVDAAHADLFKNGLFAIVAPARSSSEAIRMATELAGLLGAEHMFSDMVEIDGLMAATHLLPQLLAAGLSGITIDQPGWLEGRKIAGRAFAKVTDSVVSAESAAALANAAVHNRTNAKRVLDTLVARLLEMRAEIEAQDIKALEKRFAVVREGRINWWKERWGANWTAKELGSGSQTPTAGEWMGRLVTGYHPKGKNKK
jgi:prephenate dehydrogenase